MIHQEIQAALAAVCAADDAWQAELERQFGRQSCNARYDDRGRGAEGSNMRELYEARNEAWHVWDRKRSEGHRIEMEAWNARRRA